MVKNGKDSGEVTFHTGEGLSELKQKVMEKLDLSAIRLSILQTKLTQSNYKEVLQAAEYGATLVVYKVCSRWHGWLFMDWTIYVLM